MRKKQLSIFLYALIIIGCGIYFYYEIHQRDNFINDFIAVPLKPKIVL